MFECDCPPGNCAGLVQRYLDGQRGAGDELALKFTPLVRGVVHRVLGPSRRDEWEDACQTVFLHVFANLAKWENRCPFCKWLAVVAARRTIDLSRLPHPTPTVPLPEVANPPCQNPEAERPDGETIERVAQIVARFPPEWRQVWEGWVLGRRREDLARETGRSLRTVQYWLAEMLDQVRGELGD